ncbi:heterogeneous nuclear ribonucleoprotein A2 homolog 2-like isoform X2 [Maniola hyperantus]|uniref:heterogeneous nuclear ribonucleoprotein A2 homolog 2-like isoform X2 n=1 Tax=Aphantopus hyperantus TaxID=2795564 RepID=UPI0015692955|nr:uncharacterized PPE family protein PPE16-like isoform X1 [Maniola hyperantus]
MKLFILTLFSLILAVTSETKNSKTKAIKDEKTKTVTDQKSDNSAFLQKFLTPLNHDTNQRYGLKGVKYGNEGLIRNYNNGYYDYNDENEDYLKYERRPIESSKGLYEPNILGYSKNIGAFGGLMSYGNGGEQNVWGNFRNSEGKLRNMGVYDRRNSYSRNEGELRKGYGNNGNKGYGELRKGYGDNENKGYGEFRKGYGDMRYGNMGYNGELRKEYGNMRYGNNMGYNGELRKGYGNMRYGNKGYGNTGLGNIFYNLNIPFEPEYLGYVGSVDPKGYGIKERYYYRLIGRRGLGFDKRTATSYGLTAPITPSLLSVVGRKYYDDRDYYDFNQEGTYKI